MLCKVQVERMLPGKRINGVPSGRETQDPLLKSRARPLFFGSTGEPALTFGRPAWFEQVGREVKQAHEHAAVFDQSTLGKIRVTGRGAEAFLDRVCTNDMSRPPGRAVYTLMLNGRGGIEGDP